MESRILQNMGLPELWKSLSVMGAAQLLTVIILVSIFMIAFMVILFRKQIETRINKIHNDKIMVYPWPSEEKIIIHYLTDKLSKTESEAKEFKKMLVSEIEQLRAENISGKQFLIVMSNTTYMSEAIRNMFRELAEESIKLNIVRLIYVIPVTSKSKNMGDTQKFYYDIKNLCKKFNKPGSWAIKEGKKII